MKCRKCNTELMEGDVFCPECGTRVEPGEEEMIPVSVSSRKNSFFKENKRLALAGGAVLTVVVIGTAAILLVPSKEAAKSNEGEIRTEAVTSSTEVLESETEKPEETELEVSAVPLKCGDQIDNENFTMTFEAVELVDEYSYKTGESSKTSLYVEEGYKLLLVKGHFENKSTSVIGTNMFYLTATVNDEFIVDSNKVDFDFIRNRSFEIDPYTDMDYVMHIQVPDKLAEMFETVSFTVGYQDDLSLPVIRYESDGTKTVKMDHTYVFTSGLVAGETSEAENGQTETKAAETTAAETAKGSWSKGFYVDDFNQPTDEWYITSPLLPGTFSNSATTNSGLYAEVLVDVKGDLAVFLYEYGRSQVKNASENYVDTYTITMRTADGVDHELSGTIYCGGDRLYIDDAYVDEVLEVLKGEGDVAFRIVNDERTVETYLFTVKTDNFKTVYEEAVQ